MRRSPEPRRSGWWGVLAAVAGLAVGTAAGHLLAGAVPVLNHPINFGPSGLGLYALRISVEVRTNLLGLVGAALGVAATLRG